MTAKEQASRRNKLIAMKDHLSNAREGLLAYERDYGIDGLVHSLRELLRTAQNTLSTSLALLDGAWIDDEAGQGEDLHEPPAHEPAVANLPDVIAELGGYPDLYPVQQPRPNRRLE